MVDHGSVAISALLGCRRHVLCGRLSLLASLLVSHAPDEV